MAINRNKKYNLLKTIGGAAMNLLATVICALIIGLACSESICTHGKSYPHDSDCSKFKTCVSGSFWEKICPPGLHFSPTLEMCDWPFLANCSPKNATGCQNPGQMLSHESDCSKFYECDSLNQPVEMSCAGGLHFNAKEQICDWPWNAGCSSGAEHNLHTADEGTNISEGSDAMEAQNVQKQSVKINQYNGIFVNKTNDFQSNLENTEKILYTIEDSDAKKAYNVQKQNNKVNKYSGAFDETNYRNQQNNKQAEEPTVNNKKYYSASISGEEKDITDAGEKEENYRSEQAPVGIKCSHVDQMIAHTDCSRFYLCTANLDPVEMHCYKGLHFNIQLKICDWPQNAGCEKTVETNQKDQNKISSVMQQYAYGFENGDCPEGLNQPFPEDCAKFYQCHEGQLTEKLCPEGLHFNSRNLMCDWPANANCSYPSTLISTNARENYCDCSSPDSTFELSDLSDNCQFSACICSHKISVDMPCSNLQQNDVFGWKNQVCSKCKSAVGPISSTTTEAPSTVPPMTCSCKNDSFNLVEMVSDSQEDCGSFSVCFCSLGQLFPEDNLNCRIFPDRPYFDEELAECSADKSVCKRDFPDECDCSGETDVTCKKFWVRDDCNKFKICLCLNSLKMENFVYNSTLPCPPTAPYFDPEAKICTTDEFVCAGSIIP